MTVLASGRLEDVETSLLPGHKNVLALDVYAIFAQIYSSVFDTVRPNLFAGGAMLVSQTYLLHRTHLEYYVEAWCSNYLSAHLFIPEICLSACGKGRNYSESKLRK